MLYPYPSHIHLLQLLCEPEVYEKIVQNKNFTKLQSYWMILPRYLYAYCPICQVQYSEPADTYHINGWGGIGLQNTLCATSYAKRFINKRCTHFLGIQAFLNFNGQSPTEIKYFGNSSGEVPYMTSQFFPDDLESYAVLHALPVCRIVSERFVPTYTVFFLTYFSESPKEVLARRFAEQAKWSMLDPDFRPATVQPAGFVDEKSYQLELWAKSGKLGWLDFSLPQLPLKIGEGTVLPEIYRAVQGNRNPTIWRREN
ncbi:MAG: hypothetical protein ABI947_18580 [Chloroflexota bacterium]